MERRMKLDRRGMAKYYTRCARARGRVASSLAPGYAPQQLDSIPTYQLLTYRFCHQAQIYW